MPDTVCPSCGETSTAQNRFCGRCGADLTSAPGSSSPELAATATSIPENSVDAELNAGRVNGRFSAGTMISERYRIVGLLGRGGMGEVYRADDLKLGQPVALKFLPGHLERDPLKLSRFLNEVRTALKVSHPNVCRVYDINAGLAISSKIFETDLKFPVPALNFGNFENYWYRLLVQA